MACMTHFCQTCGGEWFNNRARDHCRLCGQFGAVVSTHDEEGDDDPRWDDNEQSIREDEGDDDD
jgi:hypothetical protein